MESSSFMKERNDAFNNEVHSGPMKNDYSITVDDSRGIAFEATQGMTRKEFEDKNRRTVDALFKEPEEIGNVFEKDEKKKALTSDNVKSMVDTGGVFEKQDKLDEQPRFSETPNKRLDNIDWDAFYDESDTMDPKQPHLSRQPTRFENMKIEYHNTKDTVTEANKGLDRETLDKLKEQVDKLDNNKKEMEATMSSPKVPSSSLELK